MSTINTNIENNSVDSKSFAILRTNPKLTSNVKLLVNSIGDLYLSAFKANKELSSIEYQKFEVSSFGKYSYDISKFFRDLATTSIYQTLRLFDDNAVYSSYEFQYEDQYNYGAAFNSTKLYDEQYKIFAPIWLEKKVPSKFVIYRVEDVDYNSNYEENTVGQNSRILELLKKASIVKTFDLGNSSKIGEYLNNHVNEKLFPKSSISINFGEGSMSSFNGIDIVNGGFATKSEQLDKYYTQVDYPEIFSNEIITNGFERNGLISANIINLEFLFDDNVADDYKIYRYFGIYADDIDEGTFMIDNVTNKGEVFIKDNSYATLYDLNDTSLVPFDMIPSGNDFNIPFLRYIKDKEGQYYNLNGSKSIPNYRMLVELNKSKESLFNGFSRNGKKITSESIIPNPRGFYKLTVIDTPSDNDKIFIGDKNEIKISDYNLSDYLIIASSAIPAGRAIKNKFSSVGSFQQIAIAIAQAIKNGEIITYNVYVSGPSITIEDYAAGNNRMQNALGVYNSNLVDFIEVTGGELNSIGLIDSISHDTLFSEWDIYSMVGGSIEGQSILVKSSEIGNVNVGEWVKQKNKDNYIQIIEIEKDPIIRDFYRIILNSAVSVSNDNVFEIYDVYKTSHGSFAAYDFKDFDFDFYSTRNSDLGDLSLDVYSHPNEKQTTYAGLNSVLGNELITDEIILENSVNNEYDRLRENSLKETSLRSRIVPTINKFKLKDALNARNLPYILNAYEAFGEDNLSPNIEIDSNRNVEFMNMEHFLINKIPSSLRNNSIENGFDFNNYVDFADDGGLTIEKLKSTDFDYFKSHFNWNGYYNSANQTWYDNTAKKLWSKFNIGNLEKNSSTVFRGLRYEYLKRKENVSEFPTEFINDSNINNYKFGVVLSYYKDRDIDDNIITNNSVNIKSIKNEKFEFICIYITVNVVDNDVSDIDRHLLYTLNDIKLEEEIIDVEIPFWIDFSLNHAEFSNSYPNRHTVIRSSEITPYPAEFTKYITVDENGDFSWIYFEAEGDTYAVKVINVIDDTQITIAGIPWKFNTETGKAEGVRMNVEDIQLIPLTNFKYYRGGKNGFNVLLNEINAYKFANKFNKFKNIEYITIEENGNIINNAYSLSIESGVNIIKPSIVNATSDPDKPRAYQLFSGEIGSIISDRKDGGYLTILRRMNGEYDPLFNSVITFGDGYSFNKVNINSTERNILIYKKFNDLGIAFDSYKNNREDYGFINNYFYHKVNDENSKNILKLSRTSDKLPIYPLIGEIAIDKKKLNLFKSKYSSNFFTKAMPGGFIKLVSGTLSPIEKKNFMASTIMKVKESYDITRYTNKKENTIETLDNIRLNSLNTNSIHWYEDNTQVLMDVYLPFAILQELIEDGIQESFGKYVVPSLSYGNETTLDNDLKVYTNGNIIPRFIIDLIDIYGIKGKDLSTSFVSVDSIDDLNKNGFVQLTNFNILSYQKDGLSFRLIYNKIIGYSYNFKIHVKIQS
jgi:hypothetical protein